MIGVRKIAYACYETPDPQQQAEYYTDILGLTLIEEDKDAIYLAGNSIDHHSPDRLAQRPGSQMRAPRFPDRTGRRPADFERQTAAHGIKTETATDARFRPDHRRDGVVRGYPGHHHGGV